MSAWDAIVIGGGHNGLVAGAYLARAGARVAVLEARDKTGGAAATDAPWPEAPEIKVTRLSYVMSLMPPSIIRDLDLERHGYKLYPMGPAYQAWPDGRSLTLYDDDAGRNHEQVARFSKKDAEAMPRWDAWLEGLAAVLGPLLTRTPPKIGSRRPSDLADLLRLAWRYKGLDVRAVGDVTRLMTMSVSDLLDDWFESEQVKASLAINGVIGTWAGPDAPGTAYVMAHHSIGDVGDGHLGSWGFPEGGMGAVSDAIERSARALGATVRTGARVERVLVEVGEHHTGAIAMALSVGYIEQAFQDAKQGRGATRPFSDGCIPTVFDKTLAPEGVHVMSLFTQWCPHDWSEAPHAEELEAYADRVIDGYAELAPNLKGAILHRDVIGPWQMEREWGLVGGNIFHGELSVEQLFHMRPAPGYADYRSPIAGLYQASSATHAGGGVCAIPAYNCVREIRRDRRRERLKVRLTLRNRG